MQSQETERTTEILRILKRSFPVPEPPVLAGDPFKVLVRTIISQSTAETNTRRAYENLSRRLSVTPEVLAEADIKMVEDALRVAGLYRNKSRTMVEVSSLIVKEFNGSLDFIHSLPLDEARQKLMGLPGVGPKTADIVLLFSGKRPTLPIDTHVARVAKRLGLVPSKAGYEGIRGGLQSLYQPDEYYNVHMVFIALGRRFCKALKPNHVSCPVARLCPLSEI